MDRRGFLQNFGLVGLTAAASSAGTYWLTRPAKIPPRGIYVQMGTSITEIGSKTPIVVGSRLNLIPVNLGLHGACAGIYEGCNPSNSLCSLVDAIVSGDWSKQVQENTFEPNMRAIARAKAVDFSNVTHLGLEYGPNDFTLCGPIGACDQQKTTFKGALTYSLQKLSSAFPELRIFLIAPAWERNYEDLDADLHPNKAGIFLREYVAALLDAAAVNRVPCLDLWSKMSTNIRNFRTFTHDGTHPTEAGAIRRGEMIAAFVNATF
jgi:lysophospholipase L1-like esterase